MAIINDTEFGRIILRRTRLARQARLKLDARGVVSISVPMRAPLYLARQLLEESRPKLRQLLGKIKASRPAYQEGELIGKSHILRFEQNSDDSYAHHLKQGHLIISCPANVNQTILEATIHKGVSQALRLQATSYLPRRLRQLADTHGFTYAKTRFSSAGTRWGSCSSEGTISLNIWLMQLPFEIIDYVLVHELCHTRQLNHSAEFWDLVAACCPNYKTLRQQLRAHQPSA